MRCKLIRTNSSKTSQFIGEKGELVEAHNGGYSFCMDNGYTIFTTAPKPNTTLGDVDYPASPSISFETESGSVYEFENLERERVVDGCFKNGNQFLGFEDKDEVEY